MKHPKLIRMLAWILVFIMILEIGPIQAYATENSTDQESIDIPMPEVTSPDPVTEVPALYIEGEVTELRSEYEKHYRLTDGSFMAVQYQVPVHYEDDGQWVDIDNTLEAVTMFSGESLYQAVNGENMQVFSADLSDGTIMAMANGNHMITMSILPSESAVDDGLLADFPGNMEIGQASIVPNETVPDNNDNAVIAEILGQSNEAAPVTDATEPEQWALDDVLPDKLSSSVLYENVFPGVDLRYDTFSYNVKESIILKQQMDLDEYAYSFLLNLDGLTPELQESGDILLLDDGYEVQYIIPAPYMWDAENAYSDAVFYELDETDDGWILTVCADEEWLESKDRLYPVTIDPSFNINSNINYTTSVQTGTPQSNSSAARPGRMSCGYSTDFGKMNGYMKVTSLTPLPIGSTVVAARFTPISAAHWLDAECRMDVYMLSSEVSDAYWSSTIPWNQQPSANTIAMDFIVASQKNNVNLSPTSLDITPAYMQWMKDPETNYGLKLVGIPSQSNKNSFCRFDSSQSYITVTYRNTVGTESYYTYETQSAVRAGTGYVGDFSSALTVFKTDVSYSSTTIPFSIGHVYNSSLSGKEISAYKDNQGILAADYTKMKTGNGWQLSVQESVVQFDENGYTRQVYRDGDGTLHYFKWVQQSTYVDEDGLGLTLRQYADGANKDRSYEIKDQTGNIRFFRNNMLSYIGDANGNRIYFLYNDQPYSATSTKWHPTGENDKLTAIVAVNKGKTEDTICEFIYSEDRLIRIKDYANRITTFSYDTAGNLILITHPDGTGAQYTYDTQGRMTSMYDTEAKYGIAYEYDGDGVSEIYEYTGNENGTMLIEGTHVLRHKPSIQEVEYRYDGNDRQFETADDIINRYIFDYYGRTINAVTLDTDADRILGVTAAAYTTNSSSTPAKNNRISKTGQSGQNGVNLLKGAGLENADNYTSVADWSTVFNVTSAYTAGFSSDTVRTGLKALTTAIADSASSNNSGHRRAGMYQQVPLTADTTYTFSAYVNTMNVTNFPDGCVYVAFLDTNNGFKECGNKVTYKTSEEIDSGWQRIYCTFTPTVSGEYRVAVIQEDAIGSVYYDDLQLEVGDAPSTVNLLQNATFDIQNYWDLNTAQYAPGEGLHQNILYLTGDYSNNVRAKQRVEIGQVCTDQTFLLSGWGKAASAAGCETEFDWTTNAEIDEDHGERYFGLIAKCRYSKDSTKRTDYHYMPFNDDYDDWQFASCVIVPKSDYQEQGMVLDYIEVYVVYDNNFNTMYVDNLSLRQEPCTTYTYNTDGNVVGTASTGNESQSVEYMSDNIRPKKVRKSESEVYYYQYKESNKYLPTYISNDTTKVYTQYTYDSLGNVKETEIGQFNSSNAETSHPKIRSSATYSDDGSLLKSETNSNGQTTFYEYTIDDTRLVFWVKDPNETVVYSTYYPNNDRSKDTFIANVVSVNYTYSNGLLSRITRGGYISGNASKQNQYYNMSYDTFGNMTMVSVGQDPENAIILATYEYSENNGHLDSMTYGNDDNISYSYDELDRLTEEVWSDGTTYQYFYNSEGALAKKVDTATGNAVNYEYDSIGRLIHSSVTKQDASTQEDVTTMLTEHLYDRQNRIKEQSYQIRNSNGTFKTYSFAYTYRGSDGLLEKFESTDNYIDAYTLGYDALARLEKRTNSYFVQNYAYANAKNGTDTTTQVESIDYDAGKYATNFAEFTLTYGYNALGNIETITGTGITGQNAAYEYDIQGQLTQATTNGVTRKYIYDTYGNIREIRDASDNKLHSYTYGNADWKDLLTVYDSQAIAYEGQSLNADGTAVSGTPVSGNPVSYYNGTRWTFGWQKGRQLVSASGNGKIITYTYDMAGIRDSKTVDGVTYHYDTLNGKVVRQTWTEGTTEHVFEIVYDASGLPYSCVYNGSRYYYVLNQQGDVIRIVGYLGATLCEYHYDAWGNVLAITGTYKDTIGKVNPIRYRGYYYDTDTGFYYLQSRYYDPSIGRFINADNINLVGINGDFAGHNLFAYCGNSPVSRSDAGGTFWNIVIGATVGAIVSGLVSVISQSIEKKGIQNVDWNRVAVSSTAGAISGGFAATGVKVDGQVALNAVVGAVSAGLDTFLKTDGEATVSEYTSNMATGFFLGIIGGFIGGDGTGTRHLTKSAGQALKRVGNAIRDCGKNGIGNTVKEIFKAGKYYYTQIATQAARSGMNAIVPILESNLPSAAYNIIGAF